MQSLRIFISYSHEDEKDLRELKKHLSILKRQQIVSTWHDRIITAGKEWANEIDLHLESADIVLLLFSSDFISSEYGYDIEASRALERHTQSLTRVIPIILRPCDFLESQFSNLQALPNQAKPVSQWSDKDAAFLDITKGIRNVAKEILEQKSRHLIETKQIPMSTKDYIPDLKAIEDSPYRGLEAFKENHQEFFFGRETAITRILEALKKTSFYAIMGSSGSGKSSVVFAGILPVLRTYKKCIIFKFRPKDNPLYSLALPIVEEFEKERPNYEHIDTAVKLSKDLLENYSKINLILDKILEENDNKDKIIIIIDQFEEIFSLCNDNKIRETFLTIISEFNQDVTVILTIRADFMAKVLDIRSLSEKLQYNIYNLGPLLPEEMKEAIRSPAEKLNVGYEERLVESIVGDLTLSTKPGSLPLLEFALTRLWEKQSGNILTHEDYESIGGVSGALIIYAEEWYNGLLPGDKNQVKNIFSQLVRPVEGMDFMRRIAKREEFDKKDWILVQKLVSARLLMINQDALRNETVEIVHEALINGWERLKNWLSDDSSFLVWKEKMRVIIPKDADIDTSTIPRQMFSESHKWLQQRPKDLNPKEKKAIINTQNEINKQRTQQEILKKQEIDSLKIKKDDKNLTTVSKTKKESLISRILSTIFDLFFPFRKQNVITGAFSHYVPQNIVNEILRHPEKLLLGGEKRHLTVFYFDVDNITSLSEMLTPTQLVALVNEYLTEVSSIIFQYEGVIDRFETGSLLAEFGIPITYNDHDKRACFAALDINNGLIKSNSNRFQRNLPQIYARIGISTGNMIVGNFGSSEIFDYSVMGGSVDLANRLSYANKLYGTNILISEETYNLSKDNIITRPIDNIRVRGRSTPLRIFELISKSDEKINERKQDILFLFNKGFSAYNKRNWQEAEKCFKDCLQIDNKDFPSQVYLKRIQGFSENPPDEDWDGVYTMTIK